jgi:hypothetical protein
MTARPASSLTVRTQKSPRGAGGFGSLTQRAHISYSVQVFASAKIGGSSPRLRRWSAATSRFFCARMVALLWASHAGEPKGSPVPKPGLLTPRGLPTTFSSVVWRGIA